MLRRDYTAITGVALSCSRVSESARIHSAERNLQWKRAPRDYVRANGSPLTFFSPLTRAKIAAAQHTPIRPQLVISRCSGTRCSHTLDYTRIRIRFEQLPAGLLAVPGPLIGSKRAGSAIREPQSIPTINNLPLRFPSRERSSRD